MAGTLSMPERRYQALVSKIADGCRAVEGANLKRYHTIGSLFAEFMQGLERNKYGDASADKLAEDLQEEGVLTEIMDVRRWLYWAKALFETYPDIAKLEELSKRGFSVTHAKKLLQFSEEVRQEAESQMIQDGHVISSRELDELVKTINQRRIASAATAAAEESRTTREGGEEAEGVEEVEIEDLTEGSVEEGETAEEAPVDEGAAERPDRATATGRPTITERTVTNPLKAIRDVEKAVTKASSGIPNAFIVLRESAQLGFDSDAAQGRYYDHLRSLKANAQALMEPMNELLRGIEEELNATEVPDETP